MNSFDVIYGMLVLEQSGKGIREFFEANDVKRVIVYGLGRIGVRAVDAIRKANIDIVYCVDKDAEYMVSEKLKIITPEKLYSIKEDIDLIIVTPCDQYYDIKEEIESYVKYDIVSAAEIVEYCLEGEKFDLVRKVSKPRSTREVDDKTVYCKIAVSNANDCLKDRTIVVTGGSGGIGRATVEKICKEGGTAIAVGRNEEVLKELRDNTGCLITVEDLTMIDDYKVFFRKMETLSKGQKIDSFVNNAGVYIERKFGEYNSADFDLMERLNLKAAYFLMQSFTDYCRSKKIKGNLVYTGSIRGMWGDPGPYGIMKTAMISAVIGYARATANEGMRFNSVSPGMTASGINGLTIADDLSNDYFLGGRVLLPEEVAETIVWLLSDFSAGITGVNIPCSLGAHLRYVD